MKDGRAGGSSHPASPRLSLGEVSGSLCPAVGRRRVGLRAAPLDPSHRDHRALVERQHRHGERGHADEVGRRQDCGDADHGHDRVAAHPDEIGRVDDADVTQKRQDHRQLEGDAEGEDQRHDEREVFAHLRQKFDRRLARRVDLLERHGEANEQRHHREIDKQRAEQEEDRGRDQIGEERLALMLVEPRRDELVELDRDNREGDHGRAEHAEADVGVELLEEVGRDQRRLFRPHHTHVGLGQHVVDRPGEIEANEKGGEKSVEGPDDPGAQLDQVVHQRRLCGVDVLLAHSAAPCLTADASASGGVPSASGAGCGAFSATSDVPTSCGAGAFVASSRIIAFSLSASSSLRTLSRSASMPAAAVSWGGGTGSGGANATSDVLISGGGRAGSGGLSATSDVPTSSGAAAFVTSSRIIPAGSKEASTFAFSLSASSSLRTFSRSASRIASINWPWNSAAMRRIFPTTCPTVRMTRGRSFGGITASATIATTISLPMSKSNIEDPAERASGARGSVSPCHERRKGRAQPTLLTSWTSLASTPTRFSIERGGFGADSARFSVSSSARPFLNDFTPLATSPMMSEILPLPPNSRSATAANNIQCQMLRPPMAAFPKAMAPPGAHEPAARSSLAANVSARSGKNKLAFSPFGVMCDKRRVDMRSRLHMFWAGSGVRAGMRPWVRSGMRARMGPRARSAGELRTQMRPRAGARR